MLILVPTTLIALALGFAALQELWVLGMQGGQVQPFWTGVIGALACLLFMVSGIALWRRWKNARAFAIWAALLFIVFHAYAALPPHRNVGVGVAIVACAYGLGFLVFALRHDRTSQVSA
jgi:uncharacterized membrane protein YhaH (DUF805 family)